jgi:hypothetical protein
VKNLTNFLESSFHGDYSSWEESLKKELKISEADSRIYRKNLDLEKWPILTLDSISNLTNRIPLGREWKKASQTYVHFSLENIQEDLDNGVSVFFFEKSQELENIWPQLECLFMGHSQSEHIEVCLIGSNSSQIHSEKIQIYDESQSLTGRIAHENGGNNILELSEIVFQLIERLRNKKEIQSVFLFLDSQLFKNLAKVRALRLLISKVLEEFNIDLSIPIIGLTSYREWTFFERFTNILRNNASIASGLMADVDCMQSSGYQHLFQLAGIRELDHEVRSLRLARNSFHILSLESMLGVVQDPSSGSYHIDKMTNYYAEQSWGKMQQWLNLSAEKILEDILNESQESFLKRKESFNHRRFVLTGINDYPDSKEILGISNLPNFSFKRTAHHLEELRVRAQNLKTRPHVCLGIIGDQASLSARVNFCRNYFELLGLEVFETSDLSVIESHRDISVICTSDDNISSLNHQLQAKDKYIAGKIPLEDYLNLFMGQDCFEVLSQLIIRQEEK